jgi:demethylmenaquinone methyltransferase/2-methoxy-6-polyprenyl-1,4-benzoquinol methylase
VVLPLIERIVFQGAQDFAMIGTCRPTRAMLRDQGLEVAFTKYFFGCATGVAGRKAGPIGGGACLSSAD